MPFRDILNQGQKILTEKNVANPRFDARILLTYVLKNNIDKILFDYDAAITKEQQTQFFELISRRSKREPVSRIIGKKGFWKYDFSISKETLDPRPDTETLIEAVLSEFQDKEKKLRIIDLGTGSGCIAISLAGEYLNSEVIGVDAAKDAVLTAQKNASYLGFSDRCQFINSDWNSLEENFLQDCDIVISNPPYIKADDIRDLEEEVRIFDPHLALSGGISGLEAYRELSELFLKKLKSGTVVFVEIGDGQDKDVIEIMTNSGLIFKKKYYDLSQKIRCLSFTYK
ncbi:MAG: peptide chain release factor N(5)-glutamine methyltransferase [Alphaproteobacteria bacterium]